MNRKFEYFLNAVFYCIWLNQISFQRFIHKIVSATLSPIVRYLFTAEYREKFYERQAIGLKQWNNYSNNPTVGWNIGMANRHFGFLCTLYPGALAFILMGVSLRFSVNINSWLIILVVSGLAALFYIPVNKMVYSKDRYLKYFKRFTKEDSRWLKKWKRITAAFCLCSFLIFLSGIAVAWIILLW